MDENDKQFITSDMYMAALLKLKGFDVVEVRKDGQKKHKGFFVFEDKPERKQIVKDYFNRCLSVDALDFVNAINTIKSLLYSNI